MARARNLMLLVINGLGDAWLQRRAGASRIGAARIARMTSAFPTTTATATTTFLTGLAPIRHGRTGRHFPVPEVGRTAAVLPFRTRGEGRLLRELGINPLTWFSHQPLFDRLPAQSAVVAPWWIIDGDYNLAHSGGALRYGYGNLHEFNPRIKRALRAAARDRAD